MSAFNLTFQKLVVSSTNDNNCKTDLKLCPPQSEEKKFFFHSRSPETVLNSISFTFLSNWKTSDLHLVHKTYNQQ